MRRVRALHDALEATAPTSARTSWERWLPRRCARASEAQKPAARATGSPEPARRRCSPAHSLACASPSSSPRRRDAHQPRSARPARGAMDTGDTVRTFRAGEPSGRAKLMVLNDREQLAHFDARSWCRRPRAARPRARRCAARCGSRAARAERSRALSPAEHVRGERTGATAPNSARPVGHGHGKRDRGSSETITRKGGAAARASARAGGARARAPTALLRKARAPSAWRLGRIAARSSPAPPEVSERCWRKVRGRGHRAPTATCSGPRQADRATKNAEVVRATNRRAGPGRGAASADRAARRASCATSAFRPARRIAPRVGTGGDGHQRQQRHRVRANADVVQLIAAHRTRPAIAARTPPRASCATASNLGLGPSTSTALEADAVGARSAIGGDGGDPTFEAGCGGRRDRRHRALPARRRRAGGRSLYSRRRHRRRGTVERGGASFSASARRDDCAIAPGTRAR